MIGVRFSEEQFETLMEMLAKLSRRYQDEIWMRPTEAELMECEARLKALLVAPRDH